MEPNVESVLIDLLLNKQPGISIKLRKQEDALAEIECTDPELGAWIKDFEIGIIEALNSDDYFEHRAGRLEGFDPDRRKQLAKDILEHSKSCPFCIAKISADSEFEEMFDEFIDTNRSEIKRHLSRRAREIPDK